MTRIAFSDEFFEGLHIRPFRMSIDRIDSNLGYTIENCQLVCAIFNIAKNAASVQLIHTVMLEYARANGISAPEHMIRTKGFNRWDY